MPKKCPECDEIIEQLLFRAEAQQSGRCELDGSGWETDDENIVDSDYLCPICEERLSISDLIDCDEDGDEVETPTASIGGDADTENTTSVLLMTYYGKTSSRVGICRKCKIQHLVSSEHSTCLNCGKAEEVLTI